MRTYETIGRFEDARDDEPCMAVWACKELYWLGLRDEEVEANWRKLAGRPVGKVRELLVFLKSERRESWQYHISTFAKENKV